MAIPYEDGGGRLRVTVMHVTDTMTAFPVPQVAIVLASAGAAVVAALGLASVHLFAGRLRFLGEIPRSRVLSLAGGASVAYVFVHAMPELRQAGETLEGRLGPVVFGEEHVYLVALAGFVAYYGLEQYVRAAGGERPPGDEGETDTRAGVFRLHVGSFAAYNGLVGYLLFHREAPGIGALGLFAVAMALHFLVNDYGLRDRHRARYHRYGRWLLAGAVVAGAALGAATTVDRAALGALFAFLAGGIVLNAIKEELPAERESRFWAFAAGAASYAALLLLL